MSDSKKKSTTTGRLWWKTHWKKAGDLKVGDKFSPDPYKLKNIVKINRIVKGKASNATGATNVTTIRFEYLEGQKKGIENERSFGIYEKVIWYPPKKKWKYFWDYVLGLGVAYAMGFVSLAVLVHWWYGL